MEMRFCFLCNSRFYDSSFSVVFLVSFYFPSDLFFSASPSLSSAPFKPVAGWLTGCFRRSFWCFQIFFSGFVHLTLKSHKRGFLLKVKWSFHGILRELYFFATSTMILGFKSNYDQLCHCSLGKDLMFCTKRWNKRLQKKNHLSWVDDKVACCIANILIDSSHDKISSF